MSHDTWQTAVSTFKKIRRFKLITRQQDLLTAPVFKLNEDLLLRIFTFNASIDRRFETLPAHITLKRTSQVCSFWRKTILASPTLWGRVIDVPSLYLWMGDNWAKEVIRRTGQAPLYVTSLTYGRNNAEINMLNLILTQHWTRIRSLDLVTLFRPGDDGMVPLAWEALALPAPMLEAAHFHFVKGGHDMLYDPRFSLFGNQAPLLNTFRTASIPFNLQAPWLFNLRTLESHRPFKLREMLNALTGMPYLESFVAHNRQEPLENGDDIAHLSKVILPRLTFIEFQISTYFELALNLLDHITPSPSCRVSLNLTNTPALESKLTQIQAVISRYSQNYFMLHIPERASITFGDQHRRFSSSPNPFILNVCGPTSSNLTNALFLETFIACFQRCLTLDVNISEGALSFSDSSVKKFISSLAGLETLEATIFLFSSLLDFANDIPPILPSLKNLKYVDKRDDPPVLLAFLQWRQKIGLPIHTVTLVEEQFGSSSRDFSCLEQVTGLHVIWTNGSRDREYICGRGDPERLTWKGKRARPKSGVKKSRWGRLFRV